MADRLSTPPFPGHDWRSWAMQMVEYLQRSAPVGQENPPAPVLLARKDADSRATHDGLLMFDAAARQTVVSINKAWVPILSQTDMDGRYVNVAGDTMTGPLTLSGVPGNNHIHLNATNAAAENRRWILATIGTAFNIGPGSDAGGVVSTGFAMTRSGASLLDAYVAGLPDAPPAPESLVTRARGDARYLQLTGGALTGNFTAPDVGVHLVDGADTTAAFNIRNELSQIFGVLYGVRTSGNTSLTLARREFGSTTNTEYLALAAGAATLVVGANDTKMSATNTIFKGTIYAGGPDSIGTYGVVIKPKTDTSSNYALAIQSMGGVTNLFSVRGDGRVNAGVATYNTTVASAANLVMDASGWLARSTSLAKYKTNVAPITDGLATILALNPVTFDSLCEGDEGRRFAGFIVEEVEPVIPNAVYDENYDIRAIVAHLTKAVQELATKIADMETP